ncbi:MAG: IS1634 family transposase [Lachnospiraceae bacterium]
MRLNIVKSKNAEQLYIIKSYRKPDGKTSSMIFKKLGTMASLLPDHDYNRDNVIAWAKEQARICTEEEKSGALTLSVDFSERKQLESEQQVLFNAGYLFLQKIYYDLGLPAICQEIKERHRFHYDLDEILRNLLYARILSPASKRSSLEYMRNFLEQPGCDLHQIYRALDVLYQESDAIQAALYDNSNCMQKRNTSILYYDCTNFFFEIEEERDSCKYGRSKEHRPNPIIQMGLFLDGDGIPLAFTMFDGNQNEQPTLIPLEKKIIRDFQLSQFIVCTDAGLASRQNRQFNTIQNRSYVVTQSLKTIKTHLQEWALEPTGWKLDGSTQTYDLHMIDEELYKDRVFFKERWIKENGLEQRLIVSYSIKYKRYQQNLREHQLERAEKIVCSGTRSKKRNPNDPERFVETVQLTFDGEIAEQTMRQIDHERIAYEEAFDGFYAVCTTLQDDVSTILKINRQRWEIEESFRIMKSEFRARPVHLQRDERIKAHFLICFIALMIYRILEKQLNEQFSVREIISTLQNMNVHEIGENGYLPVFKRTRITDALHENAGFWLDRELLSKKSIKKILKASRN